MIIFNFLTYVVFVYCFVGTLFTLISTFYYLFGTNCYLKVIGNTFVGTYYFYIGTCSFLFATSHYEQGTCSFLSVKHDFFKNFNIIKVSFWLILNII
jgi:hypothetical protein